jgi:NADH:ubiquinone oxidoreductase subunit 5 (subunit L)/multisubunit Na+/H+ antiporter MnhA subunit
MFLHSFGKVTGWLGAAIRQYIDVKVINEVVGDGSGEVVKWTGRSMRPIQTGRIQQYMAFSLLLLVVVGGALVGYLFLMGIL